MRRSLARSRKDTWPAVELAIQEFEAMRDGGIVPNATVLTNIILTIGLKNHAQSHKSDGYPDRMQRKLESIGGQVRDELESMAMRGRDPNIYAALLNLSSQSANIHDAEAVWQTLETELRFSQGGSRQPLLNSLTLSAYMHALISCREYEKAISVNQGICTG
ncbi:hypothetical protein EC988_008531 [Linderina pennispora]|nr:hypothetical protein EC988_008531 [Linderina pennispora]